MTPSGEPEAPAPASEMRLAETHGGLAPSERPVQAIPAARVLQTIDLRQDRSASVAALLVVAIVGAVIAGLWFGRFAQTESVRGIVAATGGFARIDAPRAGIVTRIDVGQGAAVRPGQTLFALRMGTATAGGESAVEAEIRNLRQTRKGLQDEIARADAFIAEATRQQEQIEADQKPFYAGLAEQTKRNQAAVEKTRATVRRVAAYVRQGDATRDLLEQHERTAFDYERQVAELQLKRMEYQRQDTERKRAFRELVVARQSQRAEAQGRIETTDSRLASLRTEALLEVQAQHAGTVLALAAKVGDSVKAGQFVAAVGDPDAAPVIVVEAPARAVGLAKVGQRVVLKYDAFPFKTFGIHHGTVSYISQAAIRGTLSEERQEGGLDPRPVPLQSAYRIEIVPDRADVDAYGERVPIRIGSTLSADIVVERRRLIDWMLDPIRALRGR
ncbi:membrane fusion protein [Methylorubrum rhodinum]|uniref:Membrane fusion protein n=1 Tax=Methylorubrum rhodinum TaxID=29428 RepID=A0A840ZLH4_9HYPH|nr:HlyD family efflux transporter periplasmic adaptor subunit [Methylorubrum rhodinum]MBB5757938.1 membrane fusion protein [Methylorubrum rhodinum]